MAPRDPHALSRLPRSLLFPPSRDLISPLIGALLSPPGRALLRPPQRLRRSANRPPVGHGRSGETGQARPYGYRSYGYRSRGKETDATPQGRAALTSMLYGPSAAVSRVAFAR
ncbi:hypothetical protein [Planotetraspora sp. GP83]|uniref:hypothetical protein n=1 Tax=Planotetraspora sp. GP83 TaxID=3156264 RepID=UPI003513619D